MNSSQWQEDCMPSQVVRRFRIDITRPTTSQLVDNIPSGNINRQSSLEQELHDILKPTIAPNLK